MKRKKLSSQIIAIFIVFLFVISAVGEASYLNVYAEETTEKATRLTRTLCEEPLQSGVYYVNSNLTIDNSEYSRVTRKAGITIADGADVTIYIAAGCTLTCKGANAALGVYNMALGPGYTVIYNEEAYAGISIPSDATLTLCGEGNVVAKGGDGSAATGGFDGTKGGYMWFQIPFTDFKEVCAEKGLGGAGGMGANAPAAGIGGNANLGGNGGANSGIWPGDEEVNDEGTIAEGPDGNSGASGESGNGMGKLYVVDSVNLTATAGTADRTIANVGNGNSNASTIFRGMLILAAGGGGGANGGISGTAADIGGAAGSGGGGGSGACGDGASTGKSGSLVSEAQAGTQTTSATGGNGGNSGSFKMSDGTVLTSEGGQGGKAGKGGSGGTLYVTSTATVNGKKGTNCSDAINGASSNKSADGQKAAVCLCDKVTVDVTLDGDTGDWTNSRDIALYSGSTRSKTLSNVSFEAMPSLTITSNYVTWIPVGNKYTLYADDICIGDEITTNTPNTDLRAFMAAATVQKDDVNWPGKRVDLYQNKLEYTLEDSDGDGVYTREIYETHEGISGENEYSVYIDDIGTDQNISMDSKTASKDTYKYYTAAVTVKADGNPMSGQTAALAQNGEILYNLTESDVAGTYTKVIYKNKTDNSYDILVNAQSTGSQVQINSLDNLAATINYYTATITLNRDGAAWSDASMALVDGDGNADFLTGTNGSYTTMLAESRGNLKVYVYGTASKSPDTGGVINSTNKTYSADYYTVSLDRNASGSDIYSTEIVKSGQTMNVPTTPYMNGRTFACWCSDAAGTTAFDFTQTITSNTTIYASWETPGVSIGTLIRCNDDGTINGDGNYYKMSNLNISGFPNNGKKITMVLLDYSNATFNNLSAIFPSSIASIVTSDSRIVINFTDEQNVRDAEKLLRRIIVQPTAGQTSTIQATVYGYTD